MKNIHMFGISPKNGVKKHSFRPEKWHGFGAPFYYAPFHYAADTTQLQLAEWSHSPNEQTRARAHAAATPWLSSQAAR